MSICSPGQSNAGVLRGACENLFLDARPMAWTDGVFDTVIVHLDGGPRREPGAEAHAWRHEVTSQGDFYFDAAINRPTAIFVPTVHRMEDVGKVVESVLASTRYLNLQLIASEPRRTKNRSLRSVSVSLAEVALTDRIKVRLTDHGVSAEEVNSILNELRAALKSDAVEAGEFGFIQRRLGRVLQKRIELANQKEDFYTSRILTYVLAEAHATLKQTFNYQILTTPLFPQGD